jgi:hypothetical protein
MSPTTEMSADGSRLTVRIPMHIRKRGGRKVVIAPRGNVINPPSPRVDSALVKAIARAYRWQRLLEEGAYASMRDLAAAEKISPSYISRLLRLTLLAPHIVEAVLDARPSGAIIAQDLLQPLPALWYAQRLGWPA